MDNAGAQPEQSNVAAATSIRYLTPDTCSIHVGVHESLHVTLDDGQVFGGVFAAYAFPVEHTHRYISLVHSASDGQGAEIGIIRDLNEFPEDQAGLVRDALNRRYFVHTIVRINRIAWDHGLVAFDVETDKGRVQFLMRWKNDRAADYGAHGKVLIDVNDNRYVIPDVGALSPGERADFTRFIYW